MRRALHLCCVITFVFCCGHMAAFGKPAQKYVFTDLGDFPGGSYSTAVAINNHGQVVIQANERESYVWIPNKPNGVDGRIWSLGAVIPEAGVDPEYGTETLAYDINDKGEVVGISGSGWHYKGFRSALPFKVKVGKKLGISSLLKDGVACIPAAINNRGIIVGQLSAASTSHAVKWSASGRLASLGKFRPNDIDCAAVDINDNGVIVGCGDGVGWVLTGLHKKLLSGDATAVNNRGLIVGVYGDKACYWRGMHRYSLDRTVYRSGVDRSRCYSAAEDINDRGQIVGYISVYFPEEAQSTEHYETRAALWSGGKTLNLNDIKGIPPGWTLESAQAINNKGQIVGHARLAGNWAPSRAFLLTPI